MPIDIKKLDYHTAGYDVHGRPILVQKPRPAELTAASVVSRRSFDLARQREETAVRQAAKEANAPVKPPGYDQLSPTSKRAWQLAAQRGENRRRKQDLWTLAPPMPHCREARS
jgi:hypothetical protein